MYVYEGGPGAIDRCGGCSTDAKINATRYPRMTDTCVEYLNAWYRYRFQELNWYTAGAGQSWSLLKDMREETLVDTTHMFDSTSPVVQLPRPSPKLKGVDEVRQSSIEMNFGFSVPSLNNNATNFMGHQQPYPDPDLRNLNPNSTFYYPLQIHQSPLKIDVIVYVAGNAGILELAINNEEFVQFNTPQTANTTTFQPTPTIQLNVNQATVPSVATLRLKNIHNGYSIHSFDFVPSKN